VIVDTSPLRLSAGAGLAAAWAHTGTSDAAAAVPFVGASLEPRLGERIHLAPLSPAWRSRSLGAPPPGAGPSPCSWPA
jgi:hypothetical protein